MKKDEYEIVERSSGYWITDNFGVLNGPYDTVDEAEDDIPRQAALQYPLPLDFEKNAEGGGFPITHKWEIVDGQIGRMNKKYTHEPEGVNCPECGELTYKLFNVKSKSGQEVLLCDACKPANDRIISEGWMRGGINE